MGSNMDGYGRERYSLRRLRHQRPVCRQLLYPIDDEGRGRPASQDSHDDRRRVRLFQRGNERRPLRDQEVPTRRALIPTASSRRRIKRLADSLQDLAELEEDLKEGLPL